MPSRSAILKTSNSKWTTRGVVVLTSLMPLTIGIVLLPSWRSYAWTWMAIGLIFLCFKSIVLATTDPRRLAKLGSLLSGFVFLWPGMDLEPFLHRAEHNARQPSRVRDPLVFSYVRSGLGNLTAAMLLFGLLRSGVLREWQFLTALVGLSCLALAFLFGVFDLLAAFWRAQGVHVQKQWHFLPATRSLSDYWSRRWNRAFHDFARDHVYLPIKRRWGRSIALFISFLFSGLIHDLVVSVPAHGGLGLPTIYFLLQGLGIWVERKWIPEGAGRRIWAWLVVLAPVPLLIHRPFVEHVVLPQMTALGLY